MAQLVVARFGAESEEYDGDPRQRFEIGSVTKLFTARLLVLLEAEGVVRREERVTGWRLNATYEQLARHRAGLPRTPRRMWRGALRNPDDPWAGLTIDDLRASLPVPPRPRWFRYSNFGAAILGHAVAERAGTTWEALVLERVPLPDTGLDGPVAQPHSRRGKPVPAWSFGAIAPAGAVRSTAADLVRFTRETTDWLGWMPGGDVRWHNGGTGGSSSFVGWDRRRRTGVVLLENRARAQRLTAHGQRLLAADVG